jgi:hypothetical protein
MRAAVNRRLAAREDEAVGLDRLESQGLEPAIDFSKVLAFAAIAPRSSAAAVTPLAYRSLLARISMIVDPDGNWIELSQRASTVGALA